MSFRTELRKPGDRGVLNLIRNLLLERQNPFEPHRRRPPRREVVAVGTLIAVLFGAVLWFNSLGR
jgi:hypothetical protein